MRDMTTTTNESEVKHLGSCNPEIVYKYHTKH